MSSALIGQGPSPLSIGSRFVPPGFQWTGPNNSFTAYPLYYSNVTHPFSSGQKTLVQGWTSNLSASTWWQFIRDYTDQGNGNSVAPMVLGSTYEDFEVEGTTFNCSTPASDDAATAVDAAISGSHLPNDPRGLYMVLPSWTDITTTGGCAGAHNTTPGGHAYFFATRPTATAYGSVSPNNDYLFDNEMEVASHELAEAVTNGSHINGGGAPCAGATEIADLCAGCNGNLDWIGVKAFIGTNSAPASLHIPSVGDFWTSAVFSSEQGGHCVIGQTTPAQSNLAPCRVNSDCSWSQHCTTGFCAIPTCSDGIQNQGESDVDCGSACGMSAVTVPEQGTCTSGKKCVTTWDCVSNVCTAGICN